MSNAKSITTVSKSSSEILVILDKTIIAMIAIAKEIIPAPFLRDSLVACSILTLPFTSMEVANLTRF
jgi:hypothetical protein